MTTFFLASDAIALPTLEFVKTQGGRLVVVSGPDRPQGRGQKFCPNAVSAWALAQGVELWRPEKLDEAFMTKLRAASPEFGIVMAYGKMLSQAFLDTFPKGVWNLHASELPRLRGASPVETAIALQLPTTGVALMKVVLAMDAGPVADTIRVPITLDATGPQLRAELGVAAATLTRKNFPALAAGKVTAFLQDEKAASYCRLLTKDDTWLDFAAPATVLAARVRAFAEWMGIAVDHKYERLKVFKATALDKKALHAQGAIVSVSNGIEVSCGDGNVLRIDELQKAGGRRLPAKEFLLGHPLAVGDIFASHPLRPLENPKPFPRRF